MCLYCTFGVSYLDPLNNAKLYGQNSLAYNMAIATPCPFILVNLAASRSSRPVATSRLQESQAMTKDQPKDASTVARLSGDTIRWNSSMAWLEYMMQMLTPVKVKRPDGTQKQTHGNTGKKNKKQIQIPSNLEHGNRCIIMNQA